MPFAVFRRHQRKLLAIFAILAMFGFVLADSLPWLLSGGYGRSRRPGRRRALRQDRSTAATSTTMAAERKRRQPVHGRALGRLRQPAHFFGGTSTRASWSTP